MKRTTLITIMLFIACLGMYAQKTIQGMVTDDSGQPVPGATITIKGATQGTITDTDGKFVLEGVDATTVLSVSFIGMLPQEIAVGDQTQFEVQLKPDYLKLDDVIVVGYGTVTKRDLTGAVSSVSSEEIAMSPVNNTIEAMQGRVAGLDITRDDGRASAGVSILLRGSRSVKPDDNGNYNDEPLYIIDGLPGSISNLNPSDIVSIDILKDISSTAIYGASGANGVVMITTKKAEKGKMQIEFSSYVSFNGNPSFPKPLTGQAWLDYLKEGYKATYDTLPTSRDALLSAWGLSNAIPYVDSAKWIDWVDESLQMGIQQNTNLTIRAGNEKVQSSLSMGYNRTEGIYINDYLDKITLRENLNIQAADWVRLGIITGVVYQNRESRSSRINKSFGMVPAGDLYDDNNEINQYPIPNGDVSILVDNVAGAYRNNKKSFDLTANPYIEISPIKGLSFKSLLGTKLSSNRQGIFNSDHTYMNLVNSTNKSASYGTYFSYNYTWENILDYKFTLLQDHNLGATLITSYAKNQYETSNSSSESFTYDDYLFYNLDAGINQMANTYYEESERMSYAGRLNYNYKGKYFITGSLRYDGVSQLKKQWLPFPSTSVAWRISDESFMDWSQNWLNNMKLRAGYGVAGSDNIGAYSSVTEVTNGTDYINLGGGQITTSVPTQSITNLSLGWEKTYGYNLGLDFGIFGGKIDGTIEWYNQDSRNLIYDRDLPFSGGGFGPKEPYTLAANIARMNNKGIELTINSRNIKTSDFQWTSTLTFSRNKNKMVSIDLGSGVTADDLISEGFFIGEPRDVYYSYKKVGIWQSDEADDAAVFGLEPGDVKIESSLTKESDGIWYETLSDADGNDSLVYYTADSPYRINATNDRQILGQQKPKWVAGLNNSFTYKGFDLNIFITARWGHMIKGDLLGYFNYGSVNIPDNYDYWTETNPTNDYPRPYYSKSNPLYSVGFDALQYVDASYIKVKNITLGYTLPQTLMSKVKINNLRIYGTVYNSFIYTRSHLLKGIDPESGASDSFPLYKQLVFGINASF